MWPVVVCGIAVGGIVAWRLVDLGMKLGRARPLLARVDDLIARGMLAEAHAAAREVRNPAARVVGAALARRTAGPARVAQAARTAHVLEVARLERGFIPLAALSTVAPLFGALATALMMLKSAGPAWSAAALAPLVVGVMIAIASSVAHLWLASRVDRFAQNVRSSTDAAARAIEKLDATR